MIKNYINSSIRHLSHCNFKGTHKKWDRDATWPIGHNISIQPFSNSTCQLLGILKGTTGKYHLYGYFLFFPCYFFHAYSFFFSFIYFFLILEMNSSKSSFNIPFCCNAKNSLFIGSLFFSTIKGKLPFAAYTAHR